MKVLYKTRNGRMEIEFDADTHVQLVQQISAFAEVFEEDTCGKCKSDNIRWTVRKTQNEQGKTFDYHELRCQACGAKLAFGVLDDGTYRLFPKRKDRKTGALIGKDKAGKWTRGWVKWNPETEKEE